MKTKTILISGDFSLNTDIFDKESFFKSGAFFRKEGELFLFWGKRQVFSKIPKDPAVCRRDFFDEKPPLWQSFENWTKMDESRASDLFRSIPLKKRLWSAPGFGSFKRQFLFFKKAFEERTLKKGVPYTFEESDRKPSPPELESMIAHGLKQKTGFLFGQWDGRGGVMGLSPELLFSQKSQKKFETMALASTLSLREFEKNPERLLKDDKQRQEHEWVVIDIKNQLSPFCELTLGECRLKRTPNLVHLLTPIEFELKDQSMNVGKLLNKLHPTAALACYPRTSWKTIMGKLDEWNPRGSFGSPFGFSCGSKVIFVVVIRSLLWDNKILKLGAGCGVTPLSELEREWMEIKDKIESVKKNFGLSSADFIC